MSPRNSVCFYVLPTRLDLTRRPDDCCCCCCYCSAHLSTQPRTLVIDTWEAFDDDMTFNLGGDENVSVGARSLVFPVLVVLVVVAAAVVGVAFGCATRFSDCL